MTQSYFFLAVIFCLITPGLLTESNATLTHFEPPPASLSTIPPKTNNFLPRLAEHVVIGCLDGSIHGIEIFTGAKLWSLESDRPLLKSSLPSFIPSTKGHVYYQHDEGLELCTSSMSEFVAKLPALGEGGVMFLGSKEDSFYSIDSSTGLEAADLPGEEGHHRLSSPPYVADSLNKLVILRTDYSVKAVDSLSGQQYWNVSYGEFVAPSAMQVPQVAEEGQGGKQHRLIPHTLVSSIDGMLKLVNTESGHVLWTIRLPSPVMQILGPQYLLSMGIYLQSLELVWEVPQFSLNSSYSPENSTFVFDHQGILVVLDQLANFQSPDSLVDGLSDTSNLGPLKIYSELKNLQLIPGIHQIDRLPPSYLLPTTPPGDDDTSRADHHGFKLLSRIWHICTTMYYDIFVGNQRLSRQTALLLFSTLCVIFCLTVVISSLLHFLRKRYPSLMAPPSRELGQKQRSDDSIIQIGRLYVNTNNVLGYGSSGTIVYEGQLDNRKIAVKRMLRSHYSVAEKETSILVASDSHPNVVRYFMTERDCEFIYLALSYADYSLATFVESEEWVKLTFEDFRSILFQLAKGLRHLHRMNIVHRDIKPQNALIDSNLSVKISDMGLARKLDTRTQSHTSTVQTTLGWRAPELITELVDTTEHRRTAAAMHGSSSKNGGQDASSKQHRVKATKKMDVFNMGCLFHYVITRCHPFGEHVFRESNILSGKFTFAASVQLVPEALDLISRMISKSPENRPTIDQALKHPYFWSKRKRLIFLNDMSDFLEFERSSTQIVLDFEQACVDAMVILDGNWVSSLSRELHADLNKFRKYDITKVRDLLRVIRNKSHHYRELSDELKRGFGSWPDEYLDYFCEARFPKLLITTWGFARTRCAHSTELRRYFEDDDDLLQELHFCSVSSSAAEPNSTSQLREAAIDFDSSSTSKYCHLPANSTIVQETTKLHIDTFSQEPRSAAAAAFNSPPLKGKNTFTNHSPDNRRVVAPKAECDYPPGLPIPPPLHLY